MPPVHLGRTDMAWLTCHGQLEIPGVHGPDDDTDIGACRLHDGSLLDMQFQPSGPVAWSGRQWSSLPGISQRPRYRDPVIVGHR